VIDNQKALFMGARFGWIAGHSLGIGTGDGFKKMEGSGTG
jgi:hypothetical protein